MLQYVKNHAILDHALRDAGCLPNTFIYSHDSPGRKYLDVELVVDTEDVNVRFNNDAVNNTRFNENCNTDPRVDENTDTDPRVNENTDTDPRVDESCNTATATADDTCNNR